jgi:hypothetical protein
MITLFLPSFLSVFVSLFLRFFFLFFFTFFCVSFFYLRVVLGGRRQRRRVVFGFLLVPLALLPQHRALVNARSDEPPVKGRNAERESPSASGRFCFMFKNDSPHFVIIAKRNRKPQVRKHGPDFAQRLGRLGALHRRRPECHFGQQRSQRAV